VATIARPAILAERYGTHRYATIAAAMTVPVTLSKAGAPLAAASIGTGRFLPWAGAACLFAAVLLWSVRGRPGSIPAPTTVQAEGASSHQAPEGIAW
jgi:hypothetical protein